jgi:hypothetical protein
MNRLSILAVITASLLLLGAALPAGDAVGQQQAQQTSDVERVNAASQVFISAISTRDIGAMDKVWAHESYATFIGPLSTTVVVGWDGVRQAWEMRFSQFDRVTISGGISRSHQREGRLGRRYREGAAATQERRYARLRCLRDQCIRKAGRSLALGFPPSDPDVQAGQVARTTLLRPAAERTSTLRQSASLYL